LKRQLGAAHWEPPMVSQYLPAIIVLAWCVWLASVFAIIGHSAQARGFI
jgi:hypothetical protein